LKAWSEHLGLAGGHVRAPLMPLTPEERDALHRDLDCVGLTGRKNQQTQAA